MIAKCPKCNDALNMDMDPLIFMRMVDTHNAACDGRHDPSASADRTATEEIRSVPPAVRVTL